jgi:hypothetical protein
MRKILVAGLILALAAVPIVIASPAVAQSGSVEKTCNVGATAHYGNKAITFMRQQSWVEATWAWLAAWDSQAKCPAATRSPLWAYWWNVEMAAALFNLRSYANTLRYLSRADTWKALAQSYAASRKQSAFFNAETALADYFRNAMATLASRPRVVPVPVPQAPRYYYESAPLGSGCEDDSIDTVGDDGSIIEMLSGKVYRVADVDTPTSTLWLTAEEVLICGSRIINKDNDGETVDAERVR